MSEATAQIKTRPARLRSRAAQRLDSLLHRRCLAAGLLSLRGHSIFAPALGPASTVIDAGAHTGDFSRAVMDRFGCRCHALEPVTGLRSRIAGRPGLSIHALALAGVDGEGVIHLSDEPEANSLQPSIAQTFGSRGTEAVRLATLESFLTAQGLETIDLLKLDIEGEEIAVLDSLSDERLRQIGQISVELHDFIPGLGLSGDVARLKRRLRRAGFLALVMSQWDGNHADTLFLNRRRIPLGPAARLRLFLVSPLLLRFLWLLYRVRAWIS